MFKVIPLLSVLFCKTNSDSTWLILQCFSALLLIQKKKACAFIGVPSLWWVGGGSADVVAVKLYFFVVPV